MQTQEDMTRDPNTQLILKTVFEQLFNYFIASYNLLITSNYDNQTIVPEIVQKMTHFHTIYTNILAQIEQIDFSNPVSTSNAKSQLKNLMTSMDQYLSIDPRFIVDHPLGPDYHQSFAQFLHQHAFAKQHLKNCGLFDSLQFSLSGNAPSDSNTIKRERNNPQDDTDPDAQQRNRFGRR